MKKFARALAALAALACASTAALAGVNQTPAVTGPSGNQVNAVPSAITLPQPSTATGCVVGAAGCDMPVKTTSSAAPGAAAPAAATQIGGTDGTNLRPWLCDTSGRCWVIIYSMPAITGTVTANQGGAPWSVTFPSPPTVNLGTLGGAATAAKQDAQTTDLDAIAANTVGIATAAAQATAAGKLDALHTDLGLVSTAAGQATANTTLSTIATNTGARGQAPAAASIPVVLASDPDVRPGAGTITAADVGSSTATGQNGASLITGAATANSTVTQAINGRSGMRLQVTGTWVGTIEFDGSIDGGTTRFPIPLRVSSTGYTQSQITANAPLYGDVSGLTNVYARATAWTSGTANVRMTFSATSGAVQLTNPAQIIDNTSGARATVKPASTMASPTDTSVVTQDVNGAPFSGVTDMPVDGTTYAAGRSFQAECTGAGNVKVTFTDNSTRTIPVQVGLNIVPYAVTKWSLTGVTGALAACLYANDK